MNIILLVCRWNIKHKTSNTHIFQKMFKSIWPYNTCLKRKKCYHNPELERKYILNTLNKLCIRACHKNHNKKCAFSFIHSTQFHHRCSNTLCFTLQHILAAIYRQNTHFIKEKYIHYHRKWTPGKDNWTHLR